MQEDLNKKVTQKSKFALFALSGGSKEKEKEEKKKALATVKNMAKGVGYSNYQQKGWDVKAYMAAQKEKDKQVWASCVFQNLRIYRGQMHLNLCCVQFVSSVQIFQVDVIQVASATKTNISFI